jgi:formamidopyrimidine-DNA glycosylase
MLVLSPIMPELPEVETTLRGILPFVLKQQITAVTIRHYGLRWPIQPDLASLLTGLTVETVSRRGKYILMATAKGTLLLHLGMSGSVRILNKPMPPRKHDHVDITFANGACLRFTDPRRFGALIWTTGAPEDHPLLSHLGPEPLAADFSGEYLWQRARDRKVPIKSFIMDSKIVVGVGNIYANEALFTAGIRPKKAAGKISLAQYTLLATAIQKILRAAIKQGGTTLKDFVNSSGDKGYFKVHLQVYGRGNSPCVICKTTLKEIRLGQRSTVYCPRCQR